MENSSSNPFEDGFTSKNDIFGRKELYSQMIRVMTHSGEDNLVVALDDEWGNGKTSFVKMLQNEVNNKNENYQAIYFDAFDNDYQTDAFLAMTSHIYKLLEKENNAPKPLIDKFLKYSTKVGASLITGGTKYLIGAATSGLINGTMLDSATDKITEALSSPLEEIISEKIKALDQEKNTLAHFKETLTEIYAHTHKKHIFIIDELDRARPDFSLALLEKVKHIFSTEGWIFLLVLSRTQFQKSIEQQYGSINSKVYLNKFIHYWFELPKKSIFDHAVLQGYEKSTLADYIRNLDLNKKIIPQDGYILKTLTFLLEVNGCSLREAERCYHLMSILTNIDKASNFLAHYQVGLALCAFLKVNDNELLKNIHLKKIKIEEILSRLNISSQHSSHDLFQIILEMLKFHLLNNDEQRTAVKNGEFPTYTYMARLSDPLETLPKEISAFNVIT